MRTRRRLRRARAKRSKRNILHGSSSLTGLDDKAIKWPFLVEGMWHDGQFTYLRSNAQESPALYEHKDGKPSLVAYDLGEDGLYIARHVLGDGWLQIGKQKARWRFTVPEIAP